MPVCVTAAPPQWKVPKGSVCVQLGLGAPSAASSLLLPQFPMGPGSDGPMGGMGGMEPHHMNGSLGKSASLGRVHPAQLCPALPGSVLCFGSGLSEAWSPQEDPKRKTLPG